MEEEIKQMLERHKSVEKDDDYLAQPSVEQAKAILLFSIKKLEYLDNYVRKFIDEEDISSHNNLNLLFGALIDDLVDIGKKI